MDIEINKSFVNISSDKLSTQDNIIGSLTNCEPESSLWLAYCIGTLYNKYFLNTDDIENVDMVYTGAMIKIPLLNTTEIANYDSISVEKITKDSAINDELKYANGYNRFHKNDWVVEKYKDCVDDSILNLKSDYGIKETNGNELMCLDNNAVGTIESLEYYRKFCARYNLAYKINHLYYEDVNKNLLELERWYKDKLNERKEFLKKIVNSGSCILTKYQYTALKEDSLKKYYNGEKITYDDEKTFKLDFLHRKEECLEISNIEDTQVSFTKSTILCNFDDKKRNYRSYFKAKPVSYVYKININNAEAIAEILDMKVEELPEMLQHYTSIKNLSEGNNILNNLDPFEYVIQNHIHLFSADIKILVAKSEL